MSKNESSNFIRVMDPNGKSHKIETDDWQLAKAEGYKMILPDGSLADDEQGDDWPSLLGKSLLKGATSFVDLPSNIETLARAGVNLIDEDLVDPKPFIPTPAQELRDIIKKYGVDLEPRPKGTAQKTVSNALEFGAALPSGGATSNLLKIAAKSMAGKRFIKHMGAAVSKPSEFLLGTTENLGQAAAQGALGATIGGLSGYLQADQDVDPLTADILGTVGALAGKGMVSKALPFVPDIQKRKISSLLKNSLEGSDINKLLEYEGKHPLNIKPTTAEVAQNPGITNIHNALSENMPSITERQALNEQEILNNLRNSVGDNLSPTANELGQAGREEMQTLLDDLIAKRSKVTKPLYDVLKESENIYSTPEFDKFNKKAIEESLGSTEKELIRQAEILPKKYEHKLKPLQKKLDKMQADLDKEVEHFSKEYKDFPQTIKDQVISEVMGDKYSAVNQLKEEISSISGKYKPGHINELISNIGEDITELKKSFTQRKLIEHFGKQKQALYKDLEATPEGAAARKKWAEMSPDINQIRRDNKLLKKYISKDQFENYRIAPENLPDDILKASEGDIADYMKYLKNTEVPAATKAYFREQYLGSNEGKLPTYHKSNQLLQNKKDKLKFIYNEDELRHLNDINEYLKIQDTINRKGSKGTSATATKQAMQKEIEGQIGKKYERIPYISTMVEKSLGKIPGLADIIPTVGYKNPYYSMLEDALLNPETAQEVLKFRDFMPNKSATKKAIATEIFNRSMGRGS